LEYFADGPNAATFARPIEDPAKLLVPSVTILEVFKRMFQQLGESHAMLAAGLMRQGHVIDLDANMAVAAAVLGLDLKLPLADSVILATARAHGAVLWTQDADFEGLDGVRYFPKKA
jgi:toxin FitB